MTAVRPSSPRHEALQDPSRCRTNRVQRPPLPYIPSRLVIREGGKSALGDTGAVDWLRYVAADGGGVDQQLAGSGREQAPDSAEQPWRTPIRQLVQ